MRCQFCGGELTVGCTSGGYYRPECEDCGTTGPLCQTEDSALEVIENSLRPLPWKQAAKKWRRICKAQEHSLSEIMEDETAPMWIRAKAYNALYMESADGL